MRTIKFRGKQYKTGEWLVGDLIHFCHDVMILPLDADWFDFVPRKNNPHRLPSDTFAAGHNIYLRGFGTFKVRTTKPRKARLISRGETIIVPPAS